MSIPTWMQVHIPDDPEAPARRAVIRHILCEPGATAVAMGPQLALPEPQLQRLLLELERHGWIVSRREADELRYYPVHQETERARSILAALGVDAQRRVLMELLEEPTASLAEVAEYSRLGPDEFKQAVATLRQARILEQWRPDRIRLVDPRLVGMVELLRSMEISLRPPQGRRTIH